MNAQIKNMENDYKPFGPEWRNEVNKFSKSMLIDWFRRVLEQKQAQTEVIEDLVTIAESYEMCFPKKSSSQKKKVQHTIAIARKLLGVTSIEL